MSLDVYLTGKTEVVRCECSRCGHEHAREETEDLYEANITHNLTRMASEAGLYFALWGPEERGWTKARDLIEPMTAGLRTLESDESRFRVFDAPNGWGRYEHLVRFTRAYLAACVEHPDADVRVSR